MAYFSQEPSIIIKKPMTVRRAEIEVRGSKLRESRNGQSNSKPGEDKVMEARRNENFKSLRGTNARNRQWFE